MSGEMFSLSFIILTEKRHGLEMKLVHRKLPEKPDLWFQIYSDFKEKFKFTYMTESLMTQQLRCLASDYFLIWEEKGESFEAWKHNPIS